ncbi:MAG: YabP/YqfC family sporulation protein [Clostridia bacterium]|nr:YabP/YqfC family sporulation protein [Clostridia bacterium]
MRIYDELFKDPNDSACARCVIVPSGGGYFEGVRALGELSTEKIVVYFSRQAVEITGTDLAIKKYYEGDLQIGGKVSGVRVLSPETDGGKG